MPQPNLLGSMNVGGIELGAFQPLDVGGALQKREETRLGAEKTKLEMRKLELDIGAGERQTYLDQLKALEMELGFTKSYAEEYHKRVGYLFGLTKEMDTDEEHYNALRTVFRTMYPSEEDQALFDHVLGAVYDPNKTPQQIENIAEILGAEKDRLEKVGEGETLVRVPRKGPAEVLVEPVAKPEEGYTLGEGQVRFEGAKEIARGPTAGPSLSQGVKDILAGKGIPVSEASPMDIKMARQELQREELEIAGERGLAGTQAEIAARANTPIPTSELVNIVDPETFAPFPVGTTFAQAEAAGAITATPTQRQPIFDLDNAMMITDQMESMTKHLIVAETAEEAAIQGLKLKGGAWLRENPVAAAYLATQQAFLGVMSRTIGAEKGVLTDRDIGRIKNAFPGLRDTRVIRDIKVLSLRLLIETARRSAVKKTKGERVDYRFELAKEASLRAMETGLQQDLDVALDLLRGGGGSVEQEVQVGSTAINENTGERVRWDGQQWQAIQ